MKRFLLLVLAAIALLFGLMQLNIHPVLVFIIAFILLFAGLLAPQLFVISKSTNIAKIDRFLLKNMQQPIYGFYYGIANRDDQLVAENFEKVLEKYKNPDQQVVYKVIKGIYDGNILATKEEIESITDLKVRRYYQAIVAVEEDNAKEAMNLVEQNEKVWMRHAIASEIAQKENDMEAAKTHATKALQSVKGLQVYMLAKNYERVIPNMSV